MTTLRVTTVEYYPLTWGRFNANAPRGKNPAAPRPRSAEGEGAVRATLDLQPGKGVRIVGHSCRTGSGWGCGIAIAVHNAARRRGVRIHIRHVNGELWIARAPRSEEHEETAGA